MWSYKWHHISLLSKIYPCLFDFKHKETLMSIIEVNNHYHRHLENACGGFCKINLPNPFWKSTFKQQLGCRFDIMYCKSSFVWILTYAIAHVLLYHMISRLYLYCLNSILYFFTYSCTNVFHRRSLHTLYSKQFPWLQTPSFSWIFICLVPTV